MRTRVILPAVVVSALIASPLLADEQAVRDDLDQARQLLDANDFDAAKAKLDAADAEMANVTGGGRQPLADRVAEMRAKLNAPHLSPDQSKYTRRLDRVMTDAEGAVGNLVTWPGAERAAGDLFADPAAPAALGDDLSKAEKKFAAFKTLHAKKAEGQLSAAAEENVKAFESAWAENKPKLVTPATPGDKDTAITDMDHEIANVRRTLGAFPPDSTAKATFVARVDKVAADFAALAGSAADPASTMTTEAAAFYKAATAKAAADWPDLRAGLTIADGLDPANLAGVKGKLVGFDADNQIGRAFAPGEFPFATSYNGVPVAARYSPAVATAVKAVETKLGRSLGGSDDKWELVARVTGETGKLTKKPTASGEAPDAAATAGGTVDAPVLTIVAIHFGPLAVADAAAK